jgi:protein-tyrosine kinase
MEHIRKAVERTNGPLPDVRDSGQFLFQSQPTLAPGLSSFREVALNPAHLEHKRIVAHDNLDPRSRSFDMLRTQLLQTMDLKSWQFVGVTSATAGCGKSVVSTNLALSIARQTERSGLLIDLDLQKAQIASLLGIKTDRGIMGVLEGRIALRDALVRSRTKNAELLVLPCATATMNSSEWIASRQMRALFDEIKRDFRGWTVIFDLPPLLSGDDVISILPLLDCLLFVVGAGITTAEEIRECNRHLESADVVRVVLNKAEEAATTYYSYPKSDKKLAPRKKGVLGGLWAR